MIIDFKREHEIDGDYSMIHDDMYVPQHPFVMMIPRVLEQNGNQRAVLIAGMQDDSEMHT
jgi:hypothetical protein